MSSTGPEPKRGYTALETARITALIGAMAVKGTPTPRLTAALEKIKAEACERERIEDEVRERREKERQEQRVKRAADRGSSWW